MTENKDLRELPVQQTDVAGNVDISLAEIKAVYAALGDEGFRKLVDAFYRRVEADDILRAIFPPDLAKGREHQYLFLTQYFGGPNRYSERIGPPMLRMRHMPFAIGLAERNRWLAHMLEAIQETVVPEPHATTLRRYFTQFSLHMINQ
jgi:hemoglobin